jgi:hypothetical protein
MEKPPSIPDKIIDPERRQGDAEEYKPGVASNDDTVDFETRVHGNTRRI